MLNVTAARETEEETGLIVNPDDLELFHIITNEHESPGKPYLYLCFRVGLVACVGEPEIMKNDGKCDDMGWYALDSIPDKTVPHVKHAVLHLGTRIVTSSNMVDV